jgi:hypothetical protein
VTQEGEKMRWNGWRYWRLVMLWVSWRFDREHRKTIKPRVDLSSLKMFFYPADPGTASIQMKFIRRTEVIFSPSAYREFRYAGRIYPLKMRRA